MPEVLLQILSDLFVGTTAGLVATFLTVVFSSLWKNVIEPWYEERVYQGIRIEGRWESTVTIDNDRQVTMWNISQVAHKISVHFVAIEGRNKNNHYKGRGEIHNLSVTVIYAKNQRYTLDKGCLLLKVTQDGSAMKGYILHEDNLSGEVSTAEYSLLRIKK